MKKGKLTLLALLCSSAVSNANAGTLVEMLTLPQSQTSNQCVYLTPAFFEQVSRTISYRAFLVTSLVTKTIQTDGYDDDRRTQSFGTVADAVIQLDRLCASTYGTAYSAKSVQRSSGTRYQRYPDTDSSYYACNMKLTYTCGIQGGIVRPNGGRF